MDPGHPYTIYTLDLQAASTAEAIRISLRDFWELDVSNPDWEMLREALADPVYRDRHLISYHIEDYAKQFPEEARVFSSLAFAFNKLPGSGKVLFDSPEDLIKFPDSQSIASIFRRKTSPFGLRGDPVLWDNLAAYMPTQARPATESEFYKAIVAAVLHLTGQELAAGHNFLIEAYQTGGMSSGMVCSDFWLERGIPLLLGRFRYITLDTQKPPDTKQSSA